MTIAKQLRVRRDQIVILTLGENSVAAYAEDRLVRIPGHKVSPVDTTGAGDCFCGYLATCQADSRTIEEGIAVANAAAALAVSATRGKCRHAKPE